MIGEQIFNRKNTRNPAQSRDLDRERGVLPAPAPGVWVFLCLIALGLAACGGFDQGHAMELHPRPNPDLWWNGSYQGRRIFMDRNGNIRETALIRRECTAAGVKGTCKDRTSYYYNTRSPNAGDRNRERVVESTFAWSVEFSDTTQARFEIQDGDGRLAGTLYGGVLFAEGEKALPGTPDKHASVELRHQPLPGPEVSISETETYTGFGAVIGRAWTLWSRAAP